MSTYELCTLVQEDCLCELISSFWGYYVFKCQVLLRDSTFLQENIKISMDGRGRCYDNIFIERLWRSLKYELIYIYSFEDGKHLTEEVKKWFNFYNKERFHQALEYQTPEQVYDQSLNLT